METEDVQFSRVSLPTRLDNRVMDLRVSLLKHNYNAQKLTSVSDSYESSDLPYSVGCLSVI